MKLRREHHALFLLLSGYDLGIKSHKEKGEEDHFHDCLFVLNADTIAGRSALITYRET